MPTAGNIKISGRGVFIKPKHLTQSDHPAITTILEFDLWQTGFLINCADKR